MKTFIQFNSFYAFSHSVSEEEEGCRKHGDDEDDHHDVDEASSHEVHIPHEIADHDIYGSPECVPQEHEEGDVQKVDIGKARRKWSEGPCYGNEPRYKEGTPSFIGEEVMYLVEILLVDELEERSVFIPASMVFLSEYLADLEIQHITEYCGQEKAKKKRDNIKISRGTESSCTHKE